MTNRLAHQALRNRRRSGWGLARSRRSLRYESLESRIVLDGSGFAGNACPPDLDLSAVASQTAHVGEELTLDLFAAGAVVSDVDSSGNPTGDTIRLMLDPDVPDDTPSGATLTTAGVFHWNPTAEQIGSFHFVVIAIDQGEPPLADAEVFTVHVANRAPVVDLNGAAAGIDFEAAFVEDGGPVSLVAADMTVADEDGTQLDSAIVQITSLLNQGAEFLSVDTTDTAISATYDATAGTLQLTGSDTIENYQLVLSTLRYDNVAQDPNEADRTVAVTVSDGVDQSATATVTLSVTSVNDAPNLADPPDVQVALGQTVEFTVTATDPDSANLTFLLDRDDPGGVVPDGVTLVSADGQSAVFRWEMDAAVSAGEYRFSILVIDDDSAALADREVFTITVVDETPSVDLNGDDEAGTDFAASFTEDSGPVAIVDAGLTVNDPNDADLAGATIVLTNPQDGAAESLAVDTTGTNITAQYNVLSGVLVLSGADTLAHYAAVLRTLTYDNVSQDPGEVARTIEVTVSDGTYASAAAIATVDVTAVADAPALTLPAPFDDQLTTVDVTLGQTIQFVATATDVDTTASELMFSLDLTNSGLPGSAAMPSITSPPTHIPGGEFSWTPDTEGTFTVTVVVTDSSGVSDQRSFTVHVMAPMAAAGHAGDAGLEGDPWRDITFAEWQTPTAALRTGVAHIVWSGPFEK